MQYYLLFCYMFYHYYFKGAVPLETAALNRRRRSYAMYLFLVVPVETDTNRQLL